VFVARLAAVVAVQRPDCVAAYCNLMKDTLSSQTDRVVVPSGH
jgi:hypothetical protein